MNASKVITIALTGLRRMFRDRTALFFVLIFPLALVLMIGSIFGGGFDPGLGVVAPAGDDLADRVVEAIDGEDRVEIHHYDDEDSVRGAVERGWVQAAVIIPKGYSETLHRGESTEVQFMARTGGVGPSLRSVVESAVRTESVPIQAAQFGAANGGGSFDDALATATEDQSSVAPVEVHAMTVGDELFPDDMGQFDLGAHQQILLFMFITGIAASNALILTRQLGVSRRMLSTPTSAAVALTGEALGRYVVVAFQGAYIMVVTWLLFGVDWGDPLGAISLVLLFAAVVAGAAMLAGGVFRNDQQAGSIGIIVGLGFAALGGSMAPLEIFSPTMRTIAHITPHAWAMDGFAELVRDRGTVVDILPNLAVLAAMGAVLLTVGIREFRRSVTS